MRNPWVWVPTIFGVPRLQLKGVAMPRRGLAVTVLALAVVSMLFGTAFTSCGPQTCAKPAHVLSGNLATVKLGSGVEVDNDVWNQSEAGPQKTYVCSFHSWYAVANQPALASNPGSIKSYPDTQFLIGGKNVSQYTSLASNFAESFRRTGEWDAAYDVWLNNYSIEVMVWNEWTTHATIPQPGSVPVTIDGVKYGMWHSGSDYIALARSAGQVKSGSVDIAHVLKWLVTQHLVKNTDVPNSIEYGVEIASTAGTSQRFDVTNVTLTIK